MTRPLLQTAREVVSSTEKGVAIKLGDSSTQDSFGRLRTSEPSGLFDTQLQYDNQPLFWQEKVTSNSGLATGTHLPNESAFGLVVGPNDTYIRQTKVYHRYQPGRSQQVFITYGPASLATGIIQQMQYGDSDNGIVFKISETIASFALLSSISGLPVETEIRQANWNMDKLNGSGESGLSLDLTKSQIVVLDLEWLGVGRVRVGFVMGGQIIYCHEFLNANTNVTSYMTTANLPIRYSISANPSVTGTYMLRQICCQVSSEGRLRQDYGIPITFGNGTTTIAVTTRRPLVSVRPRALFNNIVNRATISITDIGCYTQDQDVLLEVIYGGTLTNASWANVDNTYSITEGDVSATAISGGIVIAQRFIPAGGGAGEAQASGNLVDSILSKLPLALDIDGNHPTSPLTDSLTLVATSIPGTSTDMSGYIAWREIR